MNAEKNQKLLKFVTQFDTHLLNRRKVANNKHKTAQNTLFFYYFLGWSSKLFRKIFRSGQCLVVGDN